MKFLMPPTTLLRILTIALLGPWAICAIIDGPKSAWPPGTVTNGSTTHAALATGRNFYSSYAIDGDVDSFWNDDTENVLPDILIITVPSPVVLDGIILLSSSTNWVLSYTVETLSGSNWILQAKVTDCESALRYVPFKSPVKTTQLRIEVTGNQDVYTRINELYPVFAASTSNNTSESDPTSSETRPTSSTAEESAVSNSSLPSPSPSPSMLPKSSNTVAIVGGVLGGILCITLIAFFAYFFSRKKRKRITYSPPPDQSEPQRSFPPAELSTHRLGIPSGPAYQKPELEAR